MADADDLLDYSNDSEHEDVDPSIDEDQLLNEEEEGQNSFLDVGVTNEEQVLDYEPERNQNEEEEQRLNDEEQVVIEEEKPEESPKVKIPAAYTEDVAPLQDIIAQGKNQRLKKGKRRGGAVRGAFQQNGRGRGHLHQKNLHRPGGFQHQRPFVNRNAQRPPRPSMPQPVELRGGFPPPQPGQQFEMRHPSHPPRPLMDGPPLFRPMMLRQPRPNFSGPPPHPALLEGPPLRSVEPYGAPQRLPPPLPQHQPPLTQPPPGGVGSLPQKVLINKDFRGGIIAPRNPPPVVQTSGPPLINLTSPPPLNRPPPSIRVAPPAGAEPFQFAAPPPRLDFTRPPPLLGMTVTIRNEMAQPSWSEPPPFIHRHEPSVHQAPSPSGVTLCDNSQFGREPLTYAQNDHYRSFEDLSVQDYQFVNREDLGLREEQMGERQPVRDRLGKKDLERGRTNAGTTDLREKLSRQRVLEPTQSNLVQIEVQKEDSLRQKKIAEELQLGDEYLRKLKEQEALRKQILERKAKGIKVKAAGAANSTAIAGGQATVESSHRVPQKPVNVSSLYSRALEAPSHLQALAVPHVSSGALPTQPRASVADQGTKRPLGVTIDVPAKRTKVRWRVVRDKEGNILRKIKLDDEGNEVEVVKFVNGEPQASVLMESRKQVYSKKVQISGINPSTPDDVIEDACKHFGEVRGCLIFREPGQMVQADVTFEKEESAARFLSHFNKKKLDRNVVSVQFK